MPPESAPFPLIRLHQASLIYGAKTVLDGLDWEVLPGEHWAVIGHNGAGKTSLLRLLRGAARPSAAPEKGREPAVSWGFTGEADSSPLAVRPLSSMLSSDLQRHYARQDWNIKGEEVVLSGFGDGYLLYGPPSLQEKEAAGLLAERMGASHLLDAPATSLSQGQLRLLLLARALVKKPKLLLLDEPCDGLDRATRRKMFELLEETAAEDATIICALHSGDELPACMTHSLELKQGRIVRQGRFDPQSLPPHTPKAATPAPAGKAAGLCPPRPVFSLEQADVYLKRRRVLRQINWQVKEGEQWLLTGPNGSGKTTLLRVLMGEEHVALGGRLAWFGLDRAVTLEERRRYTGYVSDWLRNHYAYDLTGLDLIVSGLRGSIGLYHAPDKAELDEARRWIKLFTLEEWSGQTLEKMSEGVSRRFLLARALAPRPRLLILDEPCSGLDMESRNMFLQCLPAALEQGSQIIFVSHSPGDLAGIASLLTHELALEDGRVAYQGAFRG
jgi:molybdate transport system ATP-binding protein